MAFESTYVVQSGLPLGDPLCPIDELVLVTNSSKRTVKLVFTIDLLINCILVLPLLLLYH